MKTLDNANLKVGDVVGVPTPVTLGSRLFRYEKIVPEVIARITPKRSKVIMESGKDFSMASTFYAMDEESVNQTKVAESVERIQHALYVIDSLQRSGKFYSTASDDDLIVIADALDRVVKKIEK